MTCQKASLCLLSEAKNRTQEADRKAETPHNNKTITTINQLHAHQIKDARDALYHVAY